MHPTFLPYRASGDDWGSIYTTQKVKGISQYLDLNTNIKANSRKCTKYVVNFKITLTFLCSVHVDIPGFMAVAFRTDQTLSPAIKDGKSV